MVRFRTCIRVAVSPVLDAVTLHTIDNNDTRTSRLDRIFTGLRESTAEKRFKGGEAEKKKPGL